jgi:hypothetical protein
MAANYDMAGMRREAILLATAGLKKTSKFYREDYETIVRGINKKTRAELIKSLQNLRAVANVSDAEIRRHCQV